METPLWLVQHRGMPPQPTVKAQYSSSPGRVAHGPKKMCYCHRQQLQMAFLVSPSQSRMMGRRLWEPQVREPEEAYVYKLNPATDMWEVDGAAIVAPVVQSNQQFGKVARLSGDGNTLAVSAPLYNVPDYSGTLGCAYTFARIAGLWESTSGPLTYETQEDLEWGEERGLALSGDGCTIALGSVQYMVGSTDDAGAAIIFRLAPDGGWTREKPIVVGTPVQNSDFGRSVALSHDGSTLVVGAQDYDPSGRGAVGVFERWH